MSCNYVTRVKRGFERHSIRCQKPAGHEGAHENKDDAGRTVLWFSDSPQTQPEDTTRYRFGRWLEESK